MNCIVFDLRECKHYGLLATRIKQLHKAKRLIKRRLEQFGHIFHVSVLLDMVDNFVHEGYLLLIKRLIVDEFGKRSHGSVVIELGYATDQQTKGCLAKFAFIIRFATQFNSKHTLELLIS